MESSRTVGILPDSYSHEYCLMSHLVEYSAFDDYCQAPSFQDGRAVYGNHTSTIDEYHLGTCAAPSGGDNDRVNQ
jgi:hypothetical protein